MSTPSVLALVASVAVALLAGCGRNDANAQTATARPAATPAAPPPSYAIAASHPRIFLNDPTRARLKQVLASNSPAARKFREQVDGQLLGRKAYAFQPWYAALMYQLTGDARYAAYAIDETDKFVAEEEAKIARSERASVAGDSYLEVGQVIGNVSLVYDWCHDRLTETQRKRWVAYSNLAVRNVWDHRGARWGDKPYPWTGWSVDNPSNNYYYSFLRATMLLGLASHGENAEAKKWLDHFRIVKFENQLLPTFNRDLQGGGSREGTGYGTAMKNLWQLYDWWERSTGERIAARTPHTMASMAHLLHSIVPTRDRLAPTGDHARDASALLFDYHREYLLVLMGLFPDEPLSGVARTLLEQSSVPQMKSSFMYFADFLYEQPGLPGRPLGELSTMYWGSGTGQVMMRSSWETDATFSNFICGPYTESHAHRDQGSFVVFKGDWLALDSNLFSRSGIDQDEVMHNLVRFEAPGGAPVKQAYNTACVLRALADQPHYTYVSARTTPSYRPDAGVKKSEREYLFIKPDTFVVFDRAEASSGVKRIFTLNLGTPPTVDGSTLRVAAGRSRLDVHRVAPAAAEVSVTAWPSARQGISGGVRVDVADAAAGKTGSHFLHVLSANGAVASVAAADKPGEMGADITFADGRSATVRFSVAGAGGHLELRDAQKQVQVQGALPAGVTPPPLFAGTPKK